MSRKKIIVIGAGIVGMACAGSLARRGFDVVVVDPSEPGSECSFGNAGNISPGSVVPYSVPGSLRQLPRWLFNPLSPLSIRPAHAARFIPWAWQWLAASSLDNCLRTSRGLRALHAGSIQAYRDLLAGTGDEGLVRASGQFYVSKRPGKAAGSELEQFMREAAGVPVSLVHGEQLRDIEPALSPEYRSGMLLPDNGGCINPQGLVQALARQFVSGGGTIVRDRVRRFDLRDRQVAGVVLSDGALTADGYVLAAGAWSTDLARQLGTDVPLESERGYHVTLTDPGIELRIPVTNKDDSFATASMTMGLRLAGTAEYAGLNAKPNWRRARMLLEQGRRMYPGLRTAEYTRWMGHRPSFPDGLPIIDRSARFPSVLFAFGNAHFGMTAAPRVGELVAQILAGQTPSLDLSPYRADRFPTAACCRVKQESPTCLTPAA